MVGCNHDKNEDDRKDNKNKKIISLYFLEGLTYEKDIPWIRRNEGQAYITAKRSTSGYGRHRRSQFCLLFMGFH